MKRAKSRALRAKSENPLRFALSPLPVSTLERVGRVQRSR
jgi:hypothetical protein